MTWAKVDDTLHSHRKIRAAGLEAMGLWLVAMSYCAAHLTDGVLTTEEVTHLSGSKLKGTKLAARLVEARLWDIQPEGWMFHDWAHYQPTREQVLADRARKVEAGKRGGQASAQARASGIRSTTGQAPSKHPGELPSRPVPSHPSDPAGVAPREGLAAIGDPEREARLAETARRLHDLGLSLPPAAPALGAKGAA
jgi:general stress protein YciG